MAVSNAVLTPGIKLHLATAITPLWQATEQILAAQNLAPPFWAFAWPGSEALARHVTETPALVAGLRVLDFAAGCGLAGHPRWRRPARKRAAEIDPLAAAAITLNASINKLKINVLCGDIVGGPCRWDIILCGDVCYEAPMTDHIMPWLRACAAEAMVIIADPRRKYAPQHGFSTLARYTVPTSLELEDTVSRQVTLFRLTP